jgi:hypothetical protein
MKTLIIILSFLAASNGFLFGEQVDSAYQKPLTQIWYDGGLIGAYSFTGSSHSNGTADGFLVGIAANWQAKERLYKIRLNFGAELQLMSVRNPNESVFEMGFLLGKKHRFHRFELSGYGGLGLLIATTRGEFLYRDPGWFTPSYYERNQTFEPSIPIDGSLFFYTSRKFGIGINCIGSITPSNFFVGTMLKITFLGHLQ